MDLCPTCHHIWHAHRHFENFPKLISCKVIADPFIINKVGKLAFKKGLKSITIRIARKPYFYELTHNGWQMKTAKERPRAPERELKLLRARRIKDASIRLGRKQALICGSQSFVEAYL